MNSTVLAQFVNETWEQEILPTLSEYIAIPCKSPAYDPEWQQHGYIEKAAQLMAHWCKERAPKNTKISVEHLEGRTPVIMIDVPGQKDDTIILYGHMDKQPEMSGWQPGLSAWKPVRKGDKLYGRGSADDGYAVFAALTAINALERQNLPHARCLILIEATEESGSYDLPHYIEAFKDQIGTPSLIVCLDSGCGNYDQLWCTTSLRGIVNGVLTVEMMREGVHSGAASGAIASTFRILRQLLSRLDDEKTGNVLVKELHCEIPPDRIEEAKHVASVLGDNVWHEYPLLDHAKPVTLDNAEIILNRTWRPALSITGMDDIPNLKNAGNVLRPKTSALLSMRLPPTVDDKAAALVIKKILEANPPYGAKVSYEFADTGCGWNAPATVPWLAKAIDQASLNYFKKPALYWGEGGSIPFMGMLGKRYPKAQFVITGVLGPHSNAHGPNEFLEINTAKHVTCCIAEIIHNHFLHA